MSENTPIPTTGDIAVIPSFQTISTWSAVFLGIAQAWSAFGWHPDWLGQANAVIPHILSILGILGVLVDNHVSGPRKVTLPFSRHVVHLRAATVLITIGALLALVCLTGCPQPVSPIGPPTTQQSLQAEQNTLNGLSTAVDLGWDAWLFYDAPHPNPIDEALATKAHAAVEAAITAAQAHIDAGDLPSTQAALKDVQAAFQAFITSTPLTKAKTSADRTARSLRH